LELLVDADEAQSEDGGPQQSDVGPTGLRTTLASMLAAVHLAPFAVLALGRFRWRSW
jgi:hypothetical protein